MPPIENTPPNPVEPTAPLVSPVHSKNPKNIAVVGAIAVLAIALFLGGFYWWTVVQNGGALFPKSAQVSVSLGFVPASPLVALSKDRMSFEPNTYAPELPGKLVIDRVLTKNGEYLLILDPVNSIANVVVRSKETGGEPYVAVTDTATMKFDLSYDEKSDTLVYLSKKLATPEEFLTTRDWDVTIFSGGAEKVIGTGLHAEVVPGKDAVIVGTFGGVLSWVPLSGAGATVLMEREQAWTFAVRPNGKEVALYNPATVQIDRINLARGPENAHITSSLAVVSRPASLTYMHDKIVVALPDSAQSSTSFMIAGDTTKSITLKNLYPNVPSAAYNLTIEL